MGGKKWTDEEKEQLIKMNNEGFSYTEIANKLGRSYYSCQQMGTKKLGLRGNMNVDEVFLNESRRKNIMF